MVFCASALACRLTKDATSLAGLRRCYRRLSEPRGDEYNVPTSRGHIMKTVNVRQLKNNPSDALRMARKAPVVVMNRDQPEAVLFHLDKDGLLGEPGVRLAIATDLYKSGSISLGKAAKVSGLALTEFIQEMANAGIPVIRGNAKTLREEITNLEAWLKRGSSSATRAR